MPPAGSNVYSNDNSIQHRPNRGRTKIPFKRQYSLRKPYLKHRSSMPQVRMKYRKGMDVPGMFRVCTGYVPIMIRLGTDGKRVSLNLISKNTL